MILERENFTQLGRPIYEDPELSLQDQLNYISRDAHAELQAELTEARNMYFNSEGQLQQANTGLQQAEKCIKNSEPKERILEKI